MDIKEKLVQEIAKNVDEFLEAEINLNSTSFCPREQLSMGISIPFSILIEHTRILSKINGLTLYEQFKLLNLDERVKKASEVYEKNSN